MKQVSEQVKKAVEAVSSTTPLRCFEYVPTMGCEPSYRYDPMMSHYHNERMRRPLMLMETGGCGERTKTTLLVSTRNIDTVQAMESQRGQLRPRHHMQHTPDKRPGTRSTSRPQGLEVKPLNDGRPPSNVSSSDEVPLMREMARSLISATRLSPGLTGMVLLEGAHR